MVAVAANGVIGRGDTLPWRLSSDLQRFKALTMGHCMLMGRKTYESIGRPLPGRQTIVLSRSGFKPDAASVGVVTDVGEVNAIVEAGRKVMVVGGAEIYRSALQFCDSIWLTRVLAEVSGDTFFPEMDWSQWQLKSTESIAAGPKDDWDTEFQVWQRK